MNAIAIDGRKLFIPGDKVRLVASPDMLVLVTGTCIYGPVGHVKYDLTWMHNGERKETCVQETEVEAIP